MRYDRTSAINFALHLRFALAKHDAFAELLKRHVRFLLLVLRELQLFDSLAQGLQAVVASSNQVLAITAWADGQTSFLLR